MVEYCLDVLTRTGGQLFGLFGLVFVLAFIMWLVSQKMRGLGGGLFGMRRYAYLVMPGVVCHETGHALGCVVTFTRIHEFVPFRIEGDRLGYVSHTVRGGFFGSLANFVIASGPVWFGCAMLVLLAWLFAGGGALPSMGGSYADTGIVQYSVDVFAEGFSMFVGVIAGGAWKSWLFPVYLYLSFCVASEVVLSDVDVKHMWGGFAWVVLAFLLLNLVPAVGSYVSLGVNWLMPYVFVAHATIAFALMLDLCFCLLLMLIGRLLGRRRR